MPDLAFVLVNEAKYPDKDGVVASGKRHGLELAPSADVSDMLTFDLRGGGTFIVALMPAPHPDAPKMAVGPTSPSVEEASAAKAHFILTALGLPGDVRERDKHMAALTATVIENTHAVGAMLGHGVVFHKAKLFAEIAAMTRNEPLPPVEIAVDVTVARESEHRMSFLTHGLARYGREEFYVTCPIRGKSALEFVYMMARWMLTDPNKQLPTGDTVGRTTEEKIVVQRVHDPAGRRAPVIRLDLMS
jgi:hypothetical protein